MSEREQEILTNLKEALPLLTERQKGYIEGMIDCKVSEKRERNRHEPEPQAV